MGPYMSGITEMLEAVRRIAGGMSGEASRSEIRRVLRKRARLLALEKGSPDSKGIMLDVIVFRLGQERYSMETKFVRGVFRIRELTFVPGTPEFVLGITIVQGRIVSLLDLRRLFGLPESGLSERDKILVLRKKDMEFGVLIEEIIALGRISLDAAQRGVQPLRESGARYLKGITPEGVMLLDGNELLADESVVVK